MQTQTKPIIKSINLGDFNKHISKEEDQIKIKSKTEKYQKKQNMIQQQADNFGLYLHYAVTANFKNSFYLTQFDTYNDKIITTLEEFKKVINKSTIAKYNFTEHNYLNVSRIFFDIDFENDDDINELFNLFSIINKIGDELGANNYYGLIEVIDDETFNELPETFINLKGILISINPNLKQSKKRLSAHIFLNVYSYRDDIETYMKKYVVNKYKTPNKIFDTSVYKTTKQSLRCSFSPKVDQENKKIREAANDTIQLLLDNPEINFNLRMSPTKDDVFVDLKSFLKNQDNQNYTNVQSKSLDDKDVDDISIFQYIKVDDKIVNLKDVLNDLNKWDFSISLDYYRHSVLTLDEFIENVKLIKVPESVPSHDYDIWIDQVINKIKVNYPRDTTNILPLYSLLFNVKEIKDKIKKPYKKGESEIPEEVQKELKYLKLVASKISLYIDEYQQQAFIESEKYDVLTSKKYKIAKKYKILNNVFRSVDTLEYYYPFLNLTFKNITQFRTYFKINSKVANELSDRLVSFMNYKEYQRLSTICKYNKLSIYEINKYNGLVEQFLKWIHDSFMYDEDYKYYLGWWSVKLNTLKSNSKYKTINKGLINQGHDAQQEGAKDSLKTYFNDILEDYFIHKSVDVNNLNKPLNGSYFNSDILVIEELPKHVKDIDNLINVIKMYTSKANLTIEEKGEKPRNICNCCDIIMNSNHTVEAMFKNKNDCDALLKRFRILTRKSLDMSNKELNDLLDTIRENRELFSYSLYQYLLNYDSSYFNQNRNELNNVMKKYKEGAIKDNETEKIKTNSDLETFTNNFKSNFTDSNKRIKIRSLKLYFTENKILLKSNTSTLKQHLIIILDNTIKVSQDKNRDLIIVKDEAYQILYNQYFIYEEPNPENKDDAEIIKEVKTIVL